MTYRIYLCHGPHCTARGAAAAKAALSRILWDLGLDASVELHASGCQDHCDHGPNLLVQPGACRYVGVSPERARAIAERHLRDGEVVEAWRATEAMRRRA